MLQYQEELSVVKLLIFQSHLPQGMHLVSYASMIYIILSLLIVLAIDFTSTTRTITITAGTNSSILNIPVADDETVEGDETFSMSLTVLSSLGPAITTGTITSATVIIIDTTGKHYHCTDSSINMHMYYLCNWFVCLFVEIRVRFVSRQYPGSESLEFVLVTLELVGGKSAFLFNITVTPSQQSPMSAEGNSIMCIIMYVYVWIEEYLTNRWCWL